MTESWGIGGLVPTLFPKDDFEILANLMKKSWEDTGLMLLIMLVRSRVDLMTFTRQLEENMLNKPKSLNSF